MSSLLKIVTSQIIYNRAIGLMASVRQWSGWRVQSKSSHTKDLKLVRDAALLNTQHYKGGNMG